jgi:hypothetical protein
MRIEVRHVLPMLMLASVVSVGMGAGGCDSSGNPYGEPMDEHGALQILSVHGNPNAPQPPIDQQMSPSRYYGPGDELGPYPDQKDQYFEGVHVAEAVGTVGEFGLTFENLSKKVTINWVYAVYIVEDLTRIIYPIPIRIADNLMEDWRDMSWVRDMQPSVFELWPMYPQHPMFTNHHSGINYQDKFIDFAPEKKWDSYALLVGQEGLKVRVTAFGQLNDGTVVVTKPGEELTLFLKPKDASQSGSPTTAVATQPSTSTEQALCGDPSLPRLTCADVKNSGYACMNSFGDDHSIQADKFATLPLCQKNAGAL